MEILMANFALDLAASSSHVANRAHEHRTKNYTSSWHALHPPSQKVLCADSNQTELIFFVFL